MAVQRRIGKAAAWRQTCSEERRGPPLGQKLSPRYCVGKNRNRILCQLTLNGIAIVVERFEWINLEVFLYSTLRL